MSTFHAKDLPFTPKGKNRDLSSLNEGDIVKVSDEIAFKAGAISRVFYAEEKEESDSNYDFDPIGESEIESMKNLLKSPLIEHRKRKSLPTDKTKSMNDSHLNLDDDLTNASEEYHKLYEDHKAKSFDTKTTETKRQTRRSMPNIQLKERNVKVDEKKDKNSDSHISELDELESAIIDSVAMLEHEQIVFEERLSDWKCILETEEIPEEDKGEVQVVIGKTEILIKGRISKTLETLKAADAYYYRGGETSETDDKHYKAVDIYGYVDIVKNEIKKTTDMFDNIRDRRLKNWPSIKVQTPDDVSSENRPTKKSFKKHRKVQATSRINKEDLRKISANLRKNSNNDDIQVEIMGFPQNETQKSFVNETNESIKELDQFKSPNKSNQRFTRSQKFNNTSQSFTTPESVKKINLSKSIRHHESIISESGSKVHTDTPRPTKERSAHSSASRRSGQQFIKPDSTFHHVKTSANKSKRNRPSDFNDCDTSKRSKID